MKQQFISILIMSALFSACNTGNTKPEIAYKGDDLTNFAQITRDKQTKAASLTINKAENWKLYSGPVVDEINLTTPILSGQEAGTFPLNVPDSVRSYFLLQTDNSTAILAERHLPMTGGFNFRDLGGIKTKDGKYTKWGKILRSDDLHNLTPEDLQYLQSIPVVTIVDFRSEGEIQSAPDRVPSGATDYPYSINPGNLNDAASGMADISSLSKLNMDSIMMQINIMMVTQDESIRQYSKFIARLQDESQIPLLFHCTAGKDRTGLGAALTLFALGVDEERIMEDYLLSNQYIKEKYAQYIAMYPEMESLFGVKKEFLGAALQQIKADHGSVENFLENVLNVDIAKMRSMYLY